MAHEHDSHDNDEHVEHHSHTKLYVAIFFFLFIVTGIEIAIPILNKHGTVFMSKQLEVATLLILMLIKGSMVGMFYMHLKGDRRMFGSLFVIPMILVFVMMLGFFYLFQPIFW